MAKFIVVAVDMIKNDLNIIFDNFLIYKSPNVIIIQIYGDQLSVTTKNPFKNTELEVIDSKLTNVDEIFTDKIQNLHGYPFKIDYLIHLNSRLLMKDERLMGPDVVFIMTFIQKYNAKAKFILHKKADSVKQFRGDMLINILLYSSIEHQDPHYKSINTYDTDGYCALVPLPPLKSKNDFISRPFDGWTWCFILLSLIGCATVWRLLNIYSGLNANSSCYFIFGTIANFLGQAIPFREHRPLQKLILQLTLMLTFILGNAYQSLIVAYITGSFFRTKISTIDEMLQGDYGFYVDEAFINQMNGSDYYERMMPKIVKAVFEKQDPFKHVAFKNIVLIENCATIDFLLNEESELGVSNYYYKLEEKFITFYLELLIDSITYFHQRLQDHSLQVFESGIKKAWTEMNPAVDQRGFMKREIDYNSNYMLNFNDILPAFYLLTIGLVISTFSFLLEIFLHDFLSKLDFAQITSWLGRQCLKN